MERHTMQCLKDKRTGTELFYLTAEDLQAQHPDNDYLLSGEVEARHLNEPGELKRLTLQDMNLHVQALGTYKRTAYKVLGYIPCEDGQYIVLVKKKFPVVWLFLLAMLAAILLAGGYFGNQILQSKQDAALGIDPNVQDYQSQLKRPENIESSQILIPGYGSFHIEKGSDIINTTLFNPEDNPCYFQFTLVDKESGEVLYESGLVPPGKGIGPIQLNKTFDEAGTYAAVLKFKTVDFEDTSINYNGSDIEVSLIVE